MKTQTLCLALLLFLSTNSIAQLLVTTRAATPGSTSVLQQRKGDILQYTVTIQNTAGTNLIVAYLGNSIPTGTSYNAGTATLNGIAVADVNGKMPFYQHGSVNSPNANAGTISPGNTATVTFDVTITASLGTITEIANVTAYNNTGLTRYNRNSTPTTIRIDYNTPGKSFYQLTAATSATTDPAFFPYAYIRELEEDRGTGSDPVYSGPTGICYDAVTNAPLNPGTLLWNSAALAYDVSRNRVYFVNNTPNSTDDLKYIDLNNVSGIRNANAYVYTGYPLTSSTGAGYNIDRMTFSNNNTGYALTSNGAELISFTVNTGNVPAIQQLGSLINDPANGTSDVLAERGGGIMGDGAGFLYLITDNGHLYRIDPATRITRFLGAITGLPAGQINSVAVAFTNKVLVGGSFQGTYVVDLGILSATLLTPVNASNSYTNTDFTSSNNLVIEPFIKFNSYYINTTGRAFVVSGDVVEYVTEVINTGNVPEAGIKVSQFVPASAHYLPNSTTLNGVPVADINGQMPFAAGVQLVNSPGSIPGLLKAGYHNKAVVKFQITTDPIREICSQAELNYADLYGNSIITYSSDTTKPDRLERTCFFSDGVICGCGIALQGSLENKYSTLQWTPEEETNIDHYEIEYSDDNKTYSKLDKVSAAGKSVYHFSDLSHNIPGDRHYRINVVSKTGITAFSDTVKLSLKGIVTASPNPFGNVLKLQVQLLQNEKVQLRFYDMSGKMIKHISRQLNAGNNVLEVDTKENMPAGTYILEVLAGKNRITKEKLIKQ